MMRHFAILFVLVGLGACGGTEPNPFLERWMLVAVEGQPLPYALNANATICGGTISIRTDNTFEAVTRYGLAGGAECGHFEAMEVGTAVRHSAGWIFYIDLPGESVDAYAGSRQADGSLVTPRIGLAHRYQAR